MCAVVVLSGYSDAAWLVLLVALDSWAGAQALVIVHQHTDTSCTHTWLCLFWCCDCTWFDTGLNGTFLCSVVLNMCAARALNAGWIRAGGPLADFHLRVFYIRPLAAGGPCACGRKDWQSA